MRPLSSRKIIKQKTGLIMNVHNRMIIINVKVNHNYFGSWCFIDASQNLQWIGSFMFHNIGKCIRNFEYIFKTTVLMMSLHIQVLCALYMRHNKPTNDIGNSSEYERFVAPEKSSLLTKDCIFNPQSKCFLLRLYYSMYNVVCFPVPRFLLKFL